MFISIPRSRPRHLAIARRPPILSLPRAWGNRAKPNEAVSLPGAAAASLVGQPMPDLEARDPTYKPVSLAQIAKGKATILTLWATWCGPCLAEFPAFQKVLDRHPGKLRIVALATEDSRLNVLNFIKEHPEYGFIYLTDPSLAEGRSAILKFFAPLSIHRARSWNTPWLPMRVRRMNLKERSIPG